MGTALDVQNPESRMSLLDDKQSYLNADQFTNREKIALRYCDALRTNPRLADEEMWKELHAEFTEAELVELGHFIVLRIAGQRWSMSVRAEHGELAAFLEQKGKETAVAL